MLMVLKGSKVSFTNVCAVCLSYRDARPLRCYIHDLNGMLTPLQSTLGSTFEQRNILLNMDFTAFGIGLTTVRICG